MLHLRVSLVVFWGGVLPFSPELFPAFNAHYNLHRSLNALIVISSMDPFSEFLPPLSPALLPGPTADMDKLGDTTPLPFARAAVVFDLDPRPRAGVEITIVSSQGELASGVLSSEPGQQHAEAQCERAAEEIDVFAVRVLHRMAPAKEGRASRGTSSLAPSE
jgi:hypothetical protein